MSVPTPNTKRPRLPHYDRAVVPPKMGFTPRDKEIIETLYHFEGILADYQLTRLFFDSTRRMKARMSLLYQNKYVDRLSRQQQNAYGCMAYFLDEQGTNYLCNKWGILPKELNPRTRGERQSLIRHDITLNDVRIAILMALHAMPQFELLEWINSRSFWANHDTVSYTTGKGETRKRDIRPDAYFHIRGERHRRFILEVDMRTESNERFVEEKIRPGLAYIDTDVYEERFGKKAGSFLVVTTSQARVTNMVKQAEKVGKPASAFYFTTFDEATTPNAFFTQPIWQRPMTEQLVALLESDTTS